LTAKVIAKSVQYFVLSQFFLSFFTSKLCPYIFYVNK